MALFRRRDKAEGSAPREERHLLVPCQVYCGVCEAERFFSECWRRVVPMRQCTCCGTGFEQPASLYAHVQPACPKCGERLEQPGFDYGLCDGCGSKYEIVEGTKPALLPNRRQRTDMDKHGKARSIE